MLIKAWKIIQEQIPIAINFKKLLEYFDSLKSVISKTYKLNYSNGHTTIEDNYFWAEGAK